MKETNPDLGKAVDYRQHFDLVEQMSYLFVRVVRARGLMGKDANGLSDPVSVSFENATEALISFGFKYRAIHG